MNSPRFFAGKIRLHHQHHRGRRGPDDRREIFCGIVSKILQHRDTGGLGGVGSHQQRVTVRTSARDLLGADRAKRAGAVLDHDRLPKSLLQMLAEHARDLVGSCTGRKRHDDFYLTLRVIAGGKGSMQRRNPGQDKAGENDRSQLHRQFLQELEISGGFP
jgi:hypothetical protein